MQELNPTWKRMLPVWWLIVWRSLTFGVVVSIFLFVFVLPAAVIVDAATKSTAIVLQILLLLAGFLWHLIVMRMAIRKKYRDFRIALISY